MLCETPVLLYQAAMSYRIMERYLIFNSLKLEVVRFATHLSHSTTIQLSIAIWTQYQDQTALKTALYHSSLLVSSGILKAQRQALFRFPQSPTLRSFFRKLTRRLTVIATKTSTALT